VPLAWISSTMRSTSRVARDGVEPDCGQNDARALLAFGSRHSRELEPVRHVGERRPAQHDGALKHHRLCARAASVDVAAPDDAARCRRQEPVAEAHQHTLAGPVRSEDHGSGSRRELARHTIDDHAPAGDERYVL
jgi:hypothetical protein